METALSQVSNWWLNVATFVHSSPLQSTPVHSENTDFLLEIKHLLEYQQLTELSQNGLKILVSGVPVSFRALSPLLPHVDVAQRAIIIAALDPPIEILFKKA